MERLIDRRKKVAEKRPETITMYSIEMLEVFKNYKSSVTRGKARGDDGGYDPMRETGN